MADRNYPFKISTFEDKVDGTRLMLQVGGFRSKDEAEDFAKVVLQFMEDVGETWSSRVQ